MVLFVVSSCKKTDKSEQFAKKNQLSVSELRLLYNTKLGLTQKPNAGQIEVRDGINWKKAVSLKKLNGSNLLSIPIPSTQTDLSNGAQRRLVANRNSDNKVDIAVMVVIPDKDYLIAKKGKLSIKDFTGYMLFLEIDNKFRNGYILENGKIIGEAKLEQNNVIEKQLNNAKVALGQNTINNTPNKVQYLITECEWRPGRSYVDSDGVLNIVSTKYCKTTSVPNQPTPFELEPLPEGEGGGGGIWEAYDCNNVQNGEAYTNPDCNTCMGGNTGITACNNNIEVKTDSLNAKFPCAKKLIIDRLNEISSFSNLALPFQGTGEVPNLNWDSKQLPWAAGSNNGIYQLGATESYPGWSSTIFINSKAIQNASKLLIAATAIHEIVHAYSNYLAKKNIYFPNSMNGSWANDVQY